jgi:hypothetical protein
MSAQLVSPMDIAVPPRVIQIDHVLQYDHSTQQTYFDHIENGAFTSILAASSTQTYRNNGQAYDNDQD